MVSEQIIYFGAPGTGKSHFIEKELNDLGIPNNKQFRTTIHPEYTYTDFVGQLLPAQDPKDKSKVNYNFKRGVFTEALVEAYRDLNSSVYLVIEELSRGNVSAIFGDIFQLLDRDEHSISKYPIENSDIATEVASIPNNSIKLPSNFNIICTVNTSDQSVFPMDTAFKRRFDWIYVPVDPAKIVGTNKRDKRLNNPFFKIPKMVGSSIDYIETNWQSFYMALNEFIVNKNEGMGKEEDRQLGQFFLKFQQTTIEDSYLSTSTKTGDKDKYEEAEKSIQTMINNKLLLFLWQDVGFSYGDYKDLFAVEVSSYRYLYTNFFTAQCLSNEFISFFEENKRYEKYDYA